MMQATRYTDRSTDRKRGQFSSVTDSGKRLAKASHGRTDGRTDEEVGHLTINPSPNAPRIGGQNESIHRGEPKPADRQRAVRIREPRNPTASHAPITRSTLDGWIDPSGCSWKNGGKAQGYTVRTLTRETESPASCTNSAARRIQAHEVGAQRHRPVGAACSPLAGWRGGSRGSNPLRPPTSYSAANRFDQCDCVCVVDSTEEQRHGR